MNEEIRKLAPGEAVKKEAEDLMTYDGGKKFEARPSVKSAVREMVARRPNVRPNGIFRHPTTWDQEELDFIADCLKKNIPIYTIANMVRCERHVLSRLINDTPELKQLKEDKYENLLDEAEYQADRLMKAGNASIVIHVLQTLGRKRGWVEDAESGDGSDTTSRIIMGIIPEDEVAKADADTKARKEAIDPKLMALTEEAIKAEVDKRLNVVEVEGTSKPSYEEESGDDGGESIVEIAHREDVDGYMNTMSGGQAMGGDADPWASGADSPFFQ